MARSRASEKLSSKDVEVDNLLGKIASDPRLLERILEKAEANGVVELLQRLANKEDAIKKVKVGGGDELLRRLKEREKTIKAARVEGGNYWVVDPRLNYRGKNYGDWICDWFNWFLSADSDKRNAGPVVHLRSKGPPVEDLSDTKDRKEAIGEASGFSSDPNYPKKYHNDPVIKIESDRLQIFNDQAVLVPIIVSYEFGGAYKDWGYMQDFTGLIIDNGDNPPGKNQLEISGNDVELPTGLEIKDFRVVTPIFTAVVPDVEYGRSVKDYLDVPVAPGNYPAMVDGYFVMLRFDIGKYWVHSFASAPREAAGPYFSELLYEIEVMKRPPRDGVITVEPPARNRGVFQRILHKKEESGELEKGSTALEVAKRLL
jgi:hypothetical protein